MGKTHTSGAQRMARLKERLQQGGGTRMSINLEGGLVKALDDMIKNGFGKDRSDVIRRLIRDASQAS